MFDPIFKSIKHTTGKEKKLSSTVTIVLVDGTGARRNESVNLTTATSPILNQTRVKATAAAAMFLHSNSLKYVLDFFYVHIEL